MGLYHNANGREMNFTIGGSRYRVPPDGNVKIDRRFDYVVKEAGLQLTPGPSPKGATAPEAIIASLPARPRAITDANVGRRQQQEDEGEGDNNEDLEGLRADGTFANAVDDSALGGSAGDDDAPEAGAAVVDSTLTKLQSAGVKLPNRQRPR